MRRILVYLWVLPVTIVGLVFAVVARMTGGTAVWRDGVVESYGGWLGPILKGNRLIRGGAAMTLGHVILARNAECMAKSRDHERAHVRQFERWGPLLIPMHWTVGAWLRLRGFDSYLENLFETSAHDQTSRKVDFDDGDRPDE